MKSFNHDTDRIKGLYWIDTVSVHPASLPHSSGKELSSRRLSTDGLGGTLHVQGGLSLNNPLTDLL